MTTNNKALSTIKSPKWLQHSSTTRTISDFSWSNNRRRSQHSLVHKMKRVPTTRITTTFYNTNFKREMSLTPNRMFQLFTQQQSKRTFWILNKNSQQGHCSTQWWMITMTNILIQRSESQPTEGIIRRCWNQCKQMLIQIKEVRIMVIATMRAAIELG